LTTAPVVTVTPHDGPRVDPDVHRRQPLGCGTIDLEPPMNGLGRVVEDHHRAIAEELHEPPTVDRA
jgi:hypothetical protein